MHVYRNLSQTDARLSDPSTLLCHDDSAESVVEVAAVRVVRFAAESFGIAARRVRLVLLFVALVISARGFAAVYQVPTANYPTITKALAVADNGDSILVAGGTYSAPNESFPLRVQKAVTLKGECGDKPHLKGDGEHTVVLIETGGVTLECFRITDGNGSEGINKMDGGGVCIFVGPGETRDVNIVDCIIEDNTCPSDETYDGSGGGIYCGGTYCTCFQIHIVNCIIRNNYVRGQGGGVCCALLSNVLMRETLVENNTADDHGGGVFVDVFALADINDSHLLANNCPGDPHKPDWGGKGGGLACEDFGVFMVRDSIFEDNTAKYYGGGIFTRGALFTGEHVCGGGGRLPYVSRCLVRSNRAGISGGGVYVASTGILRFLSTTLYRNDATYDGGGVFVAGGSIIRGEVHFIDCDKCNECDPYFADWDDYGDCKPYFADCNDCNDCKLEGNECGRSGGGVYLGRHALGTFGSTGFLGNSALFDGGALFLENEANGVLTDCLVTYNNSARGYAGGIRATALSHLGLDHCSVVGNFAPHKRSGLYLDADAIVDIKDSILWRNAGGSVEANGAVVNITTSLNEDGADPNNGVICCNPKYVGWGRRQDIYVDASSPCSGTGALARPYCDLQHALDGFDFRLPIYSPCVGRASDGSNMGADTGVGGLAGNITADLRLAEGTYDIRGRNIICIRNVSGAGITDTSIENAVFGNIEDCNIMDLSITAEEIFGGIVLRADANFVNCDVHHNHAGADGGGIYVAEGRCTVMQSNVSNNTCADSGGGVYAFADTATSVENSNIERNSGAAGGGLYLDVNTVSIVVDDSYVSYNGAGAGGGIHVCGQLQVTDSNFIENHASSGGGIYVQETADVNIVYCRFYRNNYNQAGSTAGGLMCLGNTKIEDSDFEENRAAYGGAIRIDSPGALLCQECTFLKNEARWRGEGAALYVTADTDPCFVNCEFLENWARLEGGAGKCLDSNAVFDHCNFVNNTAHFWNGGCFYLSSTATRFYNCNFTGKDNKNNTAGLEGGVAFLRNDDTSLFEDCLIEGSSAGTNGGAFCIRVADAKEGAAGPNFVRVHIVGCQAKENGGGIAIYDTHRPEFIPAEPNFVDVNVIECDAIWGGGVYASGDSKSTFRQCEFRENSAYDLTHPGDGGGAYFTEEAVGIFVGCALRNNYSQDDGGGMGVAEQAYVELQNTLVADNNAVDDGAGIHLMFEAKGRLTNCTLASNNSVSGRTGAGIFMEAESAVTVDSSIVWDNNPDGIRSEANPNVSYCCTQRAWPGPGNIVEDPLFGDPNNGDFHLKSQAGRYDPSLGSDCHDDGAWVKDDVTSPCIDKGDPALPIGDEPMPNGGRINMGAYGGTCEASKSLSPAPDLNRDGSVDGKDFAIFSQDWRVKNQPVLGDINRDGIVDFHDLDELSEAWLHKNPAPYLEAHWKLDEAEGNVAQDSTPNNHHALVIGELLWQPYGGKIGGALRLNGVSDYIDCNDSTALGPDKMTVSLWIRPDDMRLCHIFSRANIISRQMDYWLIRSPLSENGQLELFVGQRGSGPVSVLSTLNTPSNEWSYLAVSLDGSTASLYVRLSPNDWSLDSVDYGERVPREGCGLVIGSHQGVGRFYFGMLDDVQLYNQAVKLW